ncbi:ferrochelatase-1, chloroplastic/mitochondrial-like [Papaver somniferum]|uniref:ferrochelatase-1, chloroplastic/mitochondrial-like n=1 Tax=Papaver somniferum TaxID=3469 RepID=UPI000E6FB6F8|nr:ferrochelatase-1, chloroplastic/mitochondrial-like [Papaver somniferum]
MDAITTRVVPNLNLSGSRLRSSSQLSQTKSVVSISCCSSEGSQGFDKLERRNGDSIGRGNGLLYGPVQKQREIVCSAGAGTGACLYGEHDLEGSHAHAAEEKLGVLLLNLGGPEKLQDVQPFLFNLFADPDIIRLPRLFRFLQRPLAQLISVLRAPKSKEGYAAIGGGSPLRRITDEQAEALKMALEEKKMSANVYVGMRYWFPFTEEVVHQIKKDKITRLVVLPLYPQYSISTSGSSIRVLQDMFSKDSYLSRLPVSIIKSWYQRRGYIESMANLIEQELQKFSNPEEVMIFFSAHGVPVSYVEDAGDPYKDQMEDCIRLIMQELKARGTLNEHTLAYQSRVGPVQWLKPYTDEVLVELGKSGVKSLLAVPVSFVSEHIETLEEIDMEYRELALESGVENWGRVPALGLSPPFISDLADAVIEALPSAQAITMAEVTSEETEADPMSYIIKMFFGSILAFFLLLSPKLISTFRNLL